MVAQETFYLEAVVKFVKFSKCSEKSYNILRVIPKAKKKWLVFPTHTNINFEDLMSLGPTRNVTGVKSENRGSGTPSSVLGAKMTQKKFFFHENKKFFENCQSY